MNNVVDLKGQNQDVARHVSHMAQELKVLQSTMEKILKATATQNSQFRDFIQMAEHTERLVCQNHSITFTMLNKKQILEVIEYVSNQLNGSSYVIKFKWDTILRVAKDEFVLIKEDVSGRNKSVVEICSKKVKRLRREANKTRDKNVLLRKELVHCKKLLEARGVNQTAHVTRCPPEQRGRLMYKRRLYKRLF